MKYQAGFGNYFSTEAIENALPKNQNSPQKHHLELHAEQINGSAFTCPRNANLKSWLYRIRPSVIQSEFKFKKILVNKLFSTPQQLRWNKIPKDKSPQDFIDSLFPVATHGSPQSMSGACIYLYNANQSMKKDFFYNSDGEFLIVPQDGKLIFHTEFGSIEAKPSEIIVIPRGIKFQVEIIDNNANGYICENFGSPFTLPDLGPIGANGLANPKDFLYPTAKFNNIKKDYKLLNKYHNQLWLAKIEHNPLDVVAWHGNYAPYKYDLKLFNTINTVSFDHPDPSIFTVLTSPTDTTGIANLDFVIFPERWMVAENTFRPPYYHRNIMSEYMGLIYGQYDAKKDGFVPGGGSLHNCMSAHGPDGDTCYNAINEELKPIKQKDTLAFMFESKYAWNVTENALKADFLQKGYLDCWQNIPITDKI